MEKIRHVRARKDGFTMVEMIVTIAVLAIGVLGLYSVFTPFVALTYNSSYRLTANYLAQEGLEIVRNLRDNNFVALGVGGEGAPESWNGTLVSCETGCQLDYKTGTVAESPDNELTAYDPDAYLGIDSEGFYSYDQGATPTLFKRKITVNQLSDDILEVRAQVMWEYAGKSLSTDVVAYFYNWN